MLILAVPLLIVVLLVAGIGSLCCRRRMAAAVLLLTALGLNYITQTYPLHVLHTNVSVDATRPHLRVMTYNIGLRNPSFIDKGPGIDGFMAFVERTDADLIVLPEARMADKPELHQRLSARYPYSSSDVFARSPHYLETWVYSRYPLRDVRQVADIHYAYSMDVMLSPSQPLRLVACHLASNQSHSSLTGGDGLWSNLSDGFRQRAIDVTTLCDSLCGKEEVSLLCGDLNDLSGSYTLRMLQQRLQLSDAWWTGGCGYGCTFTGKHLYFRLDHLLYSQQLRLASVHVWHLPWSDHDPLIADFYLP